MQLDELGMALPVVLIAAVMDLLDTTASHAGKPSMAALIGRPVGTARVPAPRPDAWSNAGAIGPAPSPRPRPGVTPRGSGTGNTRVDPQ
jgi:hypothetical protein